MFGGQLGSSVCPIGVDIGGGSVKLLQLERASGSLRAIAATQRPLPATRRAKDPTFEDALGRALGEMLAEGGFKGGRCVSALPANIVQFKNVRLPQMPGDELEAAVHWEAAERLGQPARSLMTQFFDAGEVRQGNESRQEVIVMSATIEAVERHTKSLTDAGLLPVAIEVAPSALARLLHREPIPAGEDGPEAKVIVDIGYGGAKVLITRAGRVLFCKQIDIGGEAFDRAVANLLNVSMEDAAAARSAASDVTASQDRAIFDALRPLATDLAREIGLCVRYYSVTFRGKRPESVSLVGGEARHSWLTELIAEHAGLLVLAHDALSGIDLVRTPALQGTGGAWAVPAGLSLRQEARLHFPGVPALGHASSKEVAA